MLFISGSSTPTATWSVDKGEGGSGRESRADLFAELKTQLEEVVAAPAQLARSEKGQVIAEGRPPSWATPSHGNLPKNPGGKLKPNCIITGTGPVAWAGVASVNWMLTVMFESEALST